MLMKLGLIGFAGALGALSRYGLAGVVQRCAGGTWPWGTLVVNLLGCFLFGFVVSIAEDRVSISGETRAFLLVGFMGAFTTFSTFASETSQMLRDSEYLLAMGNVLAHNLLGIAVLLAGHMIGRHV